MQRTIRGFAGVLLFAAMLLSAGALLYRLDGDLFAAAVWYGLTAAVIFHRGNRRRPPAAAILFIAAAWLFPLFERMVSLPSLVQTRLDGDFVLSCSSCRLKLSLAAKTGTLAMACCACPTTCAGVGSIPFSCC